MASPLGWRGPRFLLLLVGFVAGAPRLDTLPAIGLARASGRTLVVRNVVCSKHSACEWSNATGDGIIEVLGPRAWHLACNKVAIPRQACDVERDALRPWPPRFQAAELFFDAAWLARMTQRGGFMRFPLLHGDATAWVFAQRRASAPFSPTELAAPVWHFHHLHKGVPAQPSSKTPRPPRPPTEPVSLVDNMGLNSTYFGLHVRLGDRITSNAKFDGVALAKWVYAKTKDLPLTAPGRQKPAIFLAITRVNLTALTDILSPYFDVYNSLPVDELIARGSAAAPARAPSPCARHSCRARQVHELSVDMHMALEQLVCAHANAFIGSRGSTVSTHVQGRRAPMLSTLFHINTQIMSRHEGKPRPRPRL
ncbi:hypothetical protein T492DRAFT_1087378 [Pavlovales sp. CCMP2436]|nr:hypothetical protein T492DRAFT_1087378 [Pavlovales sp. CCMP2436]